MAHAVGVRVPPFAWLWDEWVLSDDADSLRYDLSQQMLEHAIGIFFGIGDRSKDYSGRRQKADILSA